MKLVTKTVKPIYFSIKKKGAGGRGKGDQFTKKQPAQQSGAKQRAGLPSRRGQSPWGPGHPEKLPLRWPDGACASGDSYRIFLKAAGGWGGGGFVHSVRDLCSATGWGRSSVATLLSFPVPPRSSYYGLGWCRCLYLLT